MINRLQKMIFENRSGSTILMVVITISILSVLGTALLGMSTLNAGMRRTDRKYKETHYFAESTVEQAYAMAAKEVSNVLDSSIAHMESWIQDKKTNIDQAITYIKTYYKNSDGTYDIARLEQDYANHTLPDLNTTSADVQFAITYYTAYLNADLSINSAKMQSQVNTEFQAYFKTSWNGKINSLNSLLLSKDNYSFDGNAGTVEITAGDGNTFEVFDDTTAVSDFVIRSNYVYEGTKKEVSAQIRVAIPDLQYPMELQEQKTIENPIWNYGISAGGDLLVDGTLSASGNVYAYGTIPDDTADMLAFGGIVSQNGGSITITGDAVTKSFMQTKGNNSMMTLNHGNFFSNSLVVQEGAMGNQIRVQDSYLYTKDDIELNGRSSSIDITGVYIGFSDGSVSAPTHDTSSSIVINSPDIGTDSELAINKSTNLSAVNQAGIAHKNPDFSDITILVPGTASISKFVFDDGTPYQTGESVSIKGNYLAYSEELEDGSDFDVSKIIMQSLLNADKSESGLFVVRNFKGGTALTAKQKAEYFNKVYNNYKDNLAEMPGLKSGAGINISKDDYWYTLGTSFYQENSSYQLQVSKGNFETAKNILPEIRKDYQYLLGRLEYRIGDIEVDNSTEIVVGSRYINWLAPNIRSLRRDGTEQLYFDSSEAGITLTTGTYNGIFITKGDITIDGSVTVNGCLVADGNIIVKKDSNLIMKNTAIEQEKISKLVNQLPEYRFIFSNSKESRRTLDVDVSNSSFISYLYKDMIQINNWSIEE